MSTKRVKLKKCIADAWNECIKEDYPSQCINSEHALQAYFFARLKAQIDCIFSEEVRRIFIEPRLNIGDGKKDSKNVYFPDLMICSKTKIIAVIELKYQPRVDPTFMKDMETLAKIATTGREDGLTFMNLRYAGEGEPPKYEMSSDILFVWAGVHRKTTSNEEMGERWQKHVVQPLGNHFLALHAHTTKGDAATTD